MLGRNPLCSCPASKGKRLRARVAPTQCSWADRWERCTERRFLSPSRGCTEWRIWDSILCEGSRLGTGRVGVSTWGYLKPDRTPFPGRDWTPGKGRLHPGLPHFLPSCRIEVTTNWEDLQNRQIRIKNPPAGYISARKKTARGIPKGPILNFS